MRIDRGFELTWLGHSAFRLSTPGGRTVLLDPWLAGNPSCPEPLKKPGPADLILISHGHFDHLGEVVAVARESGGEVVGIFEIASWLNRRGISKTVDMNKGGTIEKEGLRITMVHADHSCGITEEDGSISYGGEACGFVITLENGYTIYFAGDTNVFGDMALIRELYAPDLAMLPIGGHYTMGPREAAHAARLLGARHVVPMHFGTFPVLKGTPAQVRSSLGDSSIEVLDHAPGDVLR